MSFRSAFLVILPDLASNTVKYQHNGCCEIERMSSISPSASRTTDATTADRAAKLQAWEKGWNSFRAPSQGK